MMRSGKSTILAVAVTLVFLVGSSHTALATIVYDSGGEHDIDFTINDDLEVRDNPSGEPTTVNLLEGALVSGDLGVFGNSGISVAGGIISHDLQTFDDSAATMCSGFVGTFNVYGKSTLRVDGGTIGSLFPTQNSRTTVAGGLIHNVWAQQNSQVSVSGASIEDMLRVWGDSQVNISGVPIREVEVANNGHLILTDVSVGKNISATDDSQVSISDATISSNLSATQRSHITLSVDSIGGTLSAEDETQVTVHRGAIGGGIKTTGHSQVCICSGPIGGILNVSESSVLTVRGIVFNYAFGEIKNTTGILTGTLPYGDPIDNHFFVSGDASIVLVYEVAANYHVDALNGNDENDGFSHPTAFATIQKGIDAAEHGDRVLVYSGAYHENIDLKGKNITLTSTDPNDPDVIAATIIDGNDANSVVIFSGAEDSNCVITGFTITDGNAPSGGGICGNGTKATIFKNIIKDNQSTMFAGGGGIFDCDGLIEGNVITGNHAGGCCGGGKGGALSECDGTIRGNIIRDNSGYYGAGLSACNGRVVSNLLVANVAVHGGALADCDGLISGCTIVGNWGSTGSAILDCNGTVTNCILWQNGAGVKEQITACSAPTYSCIEDWVQGGTSNINSDPCFVQAGFWQDMGSYYDWIDNGADYHLLPDSPCIDSGHPAYAPEPNETDLDGNPRIAGAAVDRGAYEYTTSIELSQDLFEFEAVEDYPSPDGQILLVRNAGQGILDWQIAEDCNWLRVAPGSGTSTGEDNMVWLTPVTGFLAPGDYNCTLTISAPFAVSKTIAVSLTVHANCFPKGPEYAAQYKDFLLLAARGHDPSCWCRPYQCDGDADGKASGIPLEYRVFTGDLAKIITNWRKKIADPTLDPCADIDHRDSGVPFKYRVFTGDLAKIITNWRKRDADLPADCPRRDPPPPDMVLIQSGEFEMGDHHDGMLVSLPVHTVYIDSFYMGKFEVTNEQYCDYLNSALADGVIELRDGVVHSDCAGSLPYCNTHAYDPESQIVYSDGVFSVNIKENTDMSDHPVVEVSWFGAAAYCNWQSQQKGYQACYDPATWECNFSRRGYRLPTEAEWEHAARGGEHAPYYRYPWGDSIEGAKANCWDSGDPYETGADPWTTPVGHYLPNAYGLYDITGNAWEWCNDWHSPDYYSASPYSNPRGPASGNMRVIRGGSWGSDMYNKDYCKIAYRGTKDPPYGRYSSSGFRVVLDLN